MIQFRRNRVKFSFSSILVLSLVVPGVLRSADSDAAAGRMVRANAQIHIVADLDRSIAFYREGLGLELDGKPGPLTDSTLLARARESAPRAQARTASFLIPGSEMKFMLIEFSNIERRTVQQRVYDPGVVRFSISVRDIDAALAKVKPYGITVLTSGGGPVFTQRPRNQTRAVMMKDPDGFVFEFVQADPPPASAVAASSNIYNARASLVVANIDTAFGVYRDVLGFKVREPNVVNDAVLNLEGTPGAVARTSITNPPGATNFWVLWEFTKIQRQTLQTRVQDPGSPALSLWVENLSDLLKSLKAAGARVETGGGEPIALDQETRGVLVRSPDGLLLDLLERKP
jgi:catechol 2,3-dioxygenase-like lactoylglutathione lyase family enzyme